MKCFAVVCRLWKSQLWRKDLAALKPRRLFGDSSVADENINLYIFFYLNLPRVPLIKTIFLKIYLRDQQIFSVAVSNPSRLRPLEKGKLNWHRCNKILISSAIRTCCAMYCAVKLLSTCKKIRDGDPGLSLVRNACAARALLIEF